MTYARGSRWAMLPPSMMVFPTEEYVAIVGVMGAGGGAAWPTIDLAMYLPFSVPIDATISGVKFYLVSGASAGRNYDLGIYDTAGTKLATSGAVLAATGINTWAANYTVTGGVNYYIGMSVNHATLAPWARTVTVNASREVGLAQEASATPLPATATFAQFAQTVKPTIVLTFA